MLNFVQVQGRLTTGGSPLAQFRHLLCRLRLVRVRILAISVVLCALVGPPAAGMEPTADRSGSGRIYEIRAGVLAHDVGGLWSHSKKESGVDFNVEIIFNRLHSSFLAGAVSPNLGWSVNDSGDTSKLYAGLLWEFEIKPRVFLNLGIGVAAHDGELEASREDRKGLGLPILFRIPIELGYVLSQHHRVSIMFDHVSNGALATPNEGMDTLGPRYIYRF